MEKIDLKDKLEYSKNKNFLSLLNDGEYILWSGDILKINKANKAQNRDFVITNIRFINVGTKGNFITSLFSKSIKRSIQLKDIQAITYSTLSNYFVIHVPNEYDYYLCSADRDDIISYVLYCQKQMDCPPIKMFLLQEVSLFKYSKTDKETKDKWSQENPKVLDYKGFLGMIDQKKIELENNIKNTEVIMQMDGNDVNESSFDVLKVIGKGFFGKVFLVEKKIPKNFMRLKSFPNSISLNETSLTISKVKNTFSKKQKTLLW